MRETARIEDQLRRAFEGEAWHGPSVREILQGVTAEVAAARPLPEAHTIWQIALHIAAWEDVVRRRAQGERVIDVPEAEDWPQVPEGGEAAWQETRRRLEEGNRKLRETIAALDEGRLAAPVAGTRYNTSFMLDGIVQHTLYHAGQIALLKKAAAARR